MQVPARRDLIGPGQALVMVAIPRVGHAVGHIEGTRMAPTLILLLCLASTWFMLGVIMIVQIVHYPLFGSVGNDAFPHYHAEHTRRITLVVFPPMAIELVTSAFLVFAPSPGSGRVLAGLGFASALITWIVTAFFSVPSHERLAGGFDSRALAALLRSNRVRTAAWLVHAAVVLVMTHAAFAG